MFFLRVQDPIEKKKPSDLGYDNLFEVTDQVEIVKRQVSTTLNMCIDVALTFEHFCQTPEQVQARIEKVAAEAIDEVLEGDGLRYSLAQRGTGGQTQYVAELDRNYLEYKKMMREFADA